MLGTDFEKRAERRTLIFIAAVFALFPLALYPLRGLDNNTLVAWPKVFRHVSAISVYMAVLCMIPLAWIFSRVRGPGALGLFVIAFGFGVLFWRQPEVIVDVSRYFTQAKHLKAYGIGYFVSEWGRDFQAWTDMPLMPFLYGLGFRFIEESRWVVQAINTFMFAATVSLTALTGRELFNREGFGEQDPAPSVIGGTGGALLLAIPYIYTQVPLMLVDIGAMFFLMFSAWLFIRALRHGGAYLLGASFSIVCVMFVKYSLWLMLTVHGMIVLVLLPESPKRILTRGLAVGLLSALLAGAILFYYLDVFREQIDLLVHFQKPGLKRWGESFTSTFLFHLHPLVTGFLVISLFAAIKKKEPRYLVLIWLLVVLAGFLQVRRIRYLIPVFPWIALAASYGISVLWKDRVRRFAVCAAVLMSLATAWFGYQAFLNVNNLVNLRDAGAYLDSLETPEVEVLTYPQKSQINPAVAVPILDLYTHKPLRYDYVFRTHMSRKQVKRSSFRFSWEYRNPDYYQRDLREEAAGEKTIVVIAPGESRTLDPRLAGAHRIGEFLTHEGFYRFKPFIFIYQ